MQSCGPPGTELETNVLEAQAVTLSFSGGGGGGGGYSALSVACRQKLLVSQALHLNPNKISFLISCDRAIQS